MENPSNYRALEDSIKTDFSKDMSYGDYLHLDSILSAQKPLSIEHDEMLFVIIHQASELWLKLVGIELLSAIEYVKDNDFRQAFKVISRVKQIFVQLTQSWNVLKTLTPVDYLNFRSSLGGASGFQSYSYRKIEFLLGNKNEALVKVHKSNSVVYEDLVTTLNNPSLYDETIKVLKNTGFDIDASVLNRNFSQPYTSNSSVKSAFLKVYQDSEKYYDLYELAEKLVDVEDAFQQWRFKHMYTVQRIIGNRMGTGGSSGVSFLKKALDVSFFPELFELRTEL